MSERGQAAWERCEQAIWRMMHKHTEPLHDINLLWDRLRDMANEMTENQLVRLAERWEDMVAERRARR